MTRLIPWLRRSVLGPVARGWSAIQPHPPVPGETTRSVDDLIRDVNTASGRARAAWLAFVALVAYLFVAISTTTHLDLLLGANQKLPIVDVSLPLTGFYLAAPLILVLVHLNLLILLAILGQKLALLGWKLEREPMDRQDLTSRLDTFVTTQLFGSAAYSRFPRAMMALMTWVTVELAPVVLLLGVLITFLPYQSFGILWAQRVLILADVILLWRLWPKIRIPGPGPFTLDGDGAESKWRRPILASLRVGIVIAPRIAVRGTLRMALPVFAILVATIPGESLLPQGLLVPDRWPVVQGITRTLFEGKPDLTAGKRLSPLGWSRTIVLPEGSILTGDSKSAENKEIKGDLPVASSVSLVDRSLRWAILIRVRLNNADLQRADLMGANLLGAYLQGAKLNGAYLQGAELGLARLQGANLRKTELQGASLFGSFLQGSDLDGAHLQGAYLALAHLQGADLGGASLQGANLGGTGIQGANFLETILDGASLEWVSVWNTSFKPKPRADNPPARATVECRSVKEELLPSARNSIDDARDAISRIRNEAVRVNALNRLKVFESNSPAPCVDQPQWKAWQQVKEQSKRWNAADANRLAIDLARIACKPDWGTLPVTQLVGRFPREKINPQSFTWFNLVRFAREIRACSSYSYLGRDARSQVNGWASAPDPFPDPPSPSSPQRK